MTVHRVLVPKTDSRWVAQECTIPCMSVACCHWLLTVVVTFSTKDFA